MTCAALVGMLLLVAVPCAYAQQNAPPAVGDQDLQLLRKDLRSMKKQIVAANMQLTEAESTKFWPVYDQYTAETTKLYDTRYGVIKDYAANFGSLTDAQAQSLAKRSNEVDAAVVQLRNKYLPLFDNVIGGKKTALFFQIDRRLALMIDLQLASEIPLVQP
ncbi:MAG: hypothetical protein C5B55_10890 [Blastocatellia bacterium]|nr:MAG: hypothetical protein C5B55_10890 [Blastocatellia bacterium]